MIADLGPESLKRGEAIYNRVCVNCHGTKDKPGSLPTSLRFASGRFKNGSDPYSLYRTLTHGFGQMPPQTWMVPSQKYDVIHYVRETFLKADNPTQYAARGPGLPRPPAERHDARPEPSKIEPWSAMDYGPTLTATYEISDDGTNFAYKGVAVRLDAGPGGVSRGRHWTVFDHDTMRLAASWSGDGFIDWNGINFNGRHEIHPRVVGARRIRQPRRPRLGEPARPARSTTRDYGAATAGLTARCPDPGPISGASTATATGSSSPTRSAKRRCWKCRGSRRDTRLRLQPCFQPSVPATRTMVLQVARRPKARLRTFSSDNDAPVEFALLGPERPPSRRGPLIRGQSGLRETPASRLPGSMSSPSPGR